MKRVTDEVRSAFTSADEITLTSVSKLHYMLACLHETLRVYPAIGQGIVRETSGSGQHIAGEFVPPGVYVEVQPWAINHDRRNWSNPWEFNPERFLKFDEAGKAIEAFQPFLNANINTVTNAFGDHVEALQPFSIGVRKFPRFFPVLIPRCVASEPRQRMSSISHSQSPLQGC